MESMKMWPLSLFDERDMALTVKTVGRKTKPLHGKADIGLKVGAVLNRHKMAKHFDLTITDDRFAFARNQDAIAAEAALDGFYVIRTNLPAATLDDVGTVKAYKSLAQVERAFRSLLADLATLTRNSVVTPINPERELTLYARPTPLQQKAFNLLGIDPERPQ